MLSLYKVIKNSSVCDDGEKKIVTEYEIPHKNIETKKCIKEKELGEKNAKDFMDSYEVLARTMVENARRQSDEILEKTYEDVKKIQSEAYEKGYSEGYKDGEKDGYDFGKNKADEYYEDTKNRALEESQIITSNASKLLNDCREKYKDYLKEKEDEIKNLVISILENVLKKKMKDKDFIGTMVVDALENAKKSRNIIVKCKEKYVEDINLKIDDWRKQSVFKGKIFVVDDENLKDGICVIEKENGKIVVDVDIALDKVVEIINDI